MKKLLLTICLLIGTSTMAADYYAIGVNCYNKSQITNAQINFNRELKRNPQNVNARYYLAQTYILQNQLVEANAEYTRILFIAPTSKAAELSKLGIAKIEASYRGEAIVNSNVSDNYLDIFITDEKDLIRWKSFPLNVYIQPSSHDAIIKKAFNTWTTSSKGFAKFNFVNTSPEANITVEYTDKLETSSGDETYIAGITRPISVGNLYTKSEIKLLDTLNDKDLYMTVLHEIGHAIGIKGHSTRKSDIMYSEGTGSTTISNRDVNTLLLLYKIGPKDVSKIAHSGAALAEAIRYAKASPNKAISWSNLGTAYMKEKQYANAVKSYQKAISIEPNDALNYELMGQLYSTLGKYSEALPYEKAAVEKDIHNIGYINNFCITCKKAGQKALGKSYLDKFIHNNPNKAMDPTIQSLTRFLN